MANGQVVVVGAGLTGLTLALRLCEAGLDVTVVEKLNRTGGQIHSVRPDGLVVELGAEGFVARSEALVQLSRDVGIEDQLLNQETTLTFALENGQLRALAEGEAARILGFQVKKEQRGQGIRSLKTGMGQLPERITEVLRDRVQWRLGEGARAITSRDGKLSVTVDGESLIADAVVVTAPTPVAIELLAAFDQAAALSVGRRLSNTSVTMVFDRDQIDHPLDGSGFIVPAAAKGTGFRACSFVTTKFNRGLPEHTAILRAFFRPTDDELDRDDQAWIDEAYAEVAPVLGIRGAPRHAFASSWPRALPIYDAAYREAVAGTEKTLRPHRIWLAGSHFHGAGIDAAVLSADRVAADIASELG